jgi:hypothetical protein
MKPAMKWIYFFVSHLLKRLFLSVGHLLKRSIVSAQYMLSRMPYVMLPGWGIR